MVLAGVAVLLVSVPACRMTKREEAAAPVAAVDGNSSTPGPVAPALDPYAGTQRPAAAAGQIVAGTIRTPDARVRTYRLYIPSSLAAGQAEAPLVVALHGGGGSGEQFERSSGLDGLAESNGFLVVYPDGITGPNQAVRTWNAGSCCGAAVDQQVDDVGFIRQLLGAVAATHAFGAGRVFAIGHSNGGMLAYRLACDASDVFAAVGLQAGALGVATCPVRVPVSLGHLHGTGDENVPIDGGRGIRAASGVTFRPARESAGAVATADGCTAASAPATDSGNPDLSITTWSGCPAGVDVQLIAVNGASHAWMGRDRGPIVEGLVGESYPDLDASRALWAFVSAHPRA